MKTSILCGGLIGLLLTLLCIHLLFSNYNHNRLERYSDNVLEHAEKVATGQTSDLTKANAISSDICSDDDINQLRYIAFQSRYSGDIGRIKDGKLICTANWGRLTPERALPVPQIHTENGIHVWINLPNIIYANILSDMVSLGNAISFTSPTAFYSYEQYLTSPYAGFIATVDQKHILRKFGEIDFIVKNSHQELSAVNLTASDYIVKTCSDKFDFCVFAGSKPINFFKQSLFTTIGVTLFGIFLCSTIGALYYAYRKNQHSLEHQLLRAVVHHDFVMFFQPIVRLSDHKIIGAEALIRWNDESGKPVSPEIFIKIAEDIGVIKEITRQVIHQSLFAMQDKLTDDSDFYLSINLSTQDILAPDFPDLLDTEVNQFGIHHNRIVLEITERSSAIISELSRGVNTLNQRGYRLYIDDFGTGYANIKYLTSLNVDAIKIDHSFTQMIGKKTNNAIVIEQLLTVVPSLKMNVVVEGIETVTQEELIKKLNPTALGQGYLYSRPVPRDVFFQLPTFIQKQPS